MEILLNNQDNSLDTVRFSRILVCFLFSSSLNINPNHECTTLKANNRNKFFINQQRKLFPSK